MKKNKMMRMASVLFVLTLITSCFVGGTFAKYVTSKPGSDTARVAKFGVTVNGAGNTFATAYDKNDQTAQLDTQTVISNNGDKVVAPGTKGQAMSVGLSGKTEVAVKVESVAVVTLVNWTDAEGEYYCPLVFDINGVKLDGRDYESMDAFKTAIETAIAEAKAEFAPNTDLSDLKDAKLAISWEWPFEGADVSADDVKDTYLGRQAQAGYPATVKIELTTTVTQID